MYDTEFPLIDLHRHIEGSVRLETILELGQHYNLPLPAWDIESLRPFVQVIGSQPGVMPFIEKFKWSVGILVDYEACYRIGYESVEDAFNEGIDYIELRFSPWFMAESHKLDTTGVVEATIAGVTAAVRDTGLRVNLIGILSRTYGPEIANEELSALLSHRDSLIAIDLAGDEANFPGEMFVEHIQKARDTGLAITIHAGESSGSESVWQAVLGLGADRLGHAVHAVDDYGLLNYLESEGIGIESSITSNVQTSTVSGYDAHPLRVFLENNILATINTDDPRISGINLQHEYQIAASASGLSQDQIRTAQRNALKVAFLTEQEKIALLEKRSPLDNSSPTKL